MNAHDPIGGRSCCPERSPASCGSCSSDRCTDPAAGLPGHLRLDGNRRHGDIGADACLQSSRNYATDSSGATDGLRSFLAEVARRDTSILEMASNHAGYDGWRGGVEFQADAAALRARRIVGVMLAKEAGRSAIRPGLAPTSRNYALSPRQPLVLGG
jgi:hypothetical protein